MSEPVTSTLAIGVLGLPALLAAGIASSVHCGLMCGLLHAQLARGFGWAQQAGRVSAYGLLGALAGASGAWLLRATPLLPALDAARIALPPLLIVIAIYRSRGMKASGCCKPLPARPGLTVAAVYLRGLAAGLTPCTLLYAALTYAALSASVGQGTLLMVAFGLGTVPAVQAGAWTWARIGASNAPVVAQRLALLAALGTALLMSAGLIASGGSGIWCLGRSG